MWTWGSRGGLSRQRWFCKGDIRRGRQWRRLPLLHLHILLHLGYLLHLHLRLLLHLRVLLPRQHLSWHVKGRLLPWVGRRLLLLLPHSTCGRWGRHNRVRAGTHSP